MLLAYTTPPRTDEVMSSVLAAAQTLRPGAEDAQFLSQTPAPPWQVEGKARRVPAARAPHVCDRAQD